MDNKEIKVAILFTLMLAIFTFPVKCQNEESGISDAAEGIMALTDDFDATNLLELLSELKETPVNINSGDEDEIARLFFLTEFQVRVLADHVSKNGDVVSLYEIALLPAFDRSTVMLMAPYVSLKPSEERSVAGYGRTTATVTASARFNDDENENGGVRSLLRMRHDGSRISYGITAENDPGEHFTLKSAMGPDFLSGYLMYNGRGLVNRIIIGDYALRFGEGLVFNSTSWQGSWLSSPSFMTGRSSVAQYTSSEENNFFRGISLYLGDINTGAVLFASSNMIDARLQYNEDSTATGVSNLVRGGLHVSASQLEARNSLTETVAGFHFAAGADNIRGGMTSSVTWFSLPFRPDGTKPENIYAYSGSRLLNFSADFKAGSRRVFFFTEAAMSLPGSWAVSGGIRAKPSDRVTCNILVRHFSPDYYAFHSGAFKIGSGSGNETGIAMSLHLEAARHLFITAAADHYRIPWLRYRSSSPSYGSRIEIRGEYQPRDDLSLRLTYTSSSHEYDVASETGTAVSEAQIRQQLSFILNCNPASGLRLTTRASASFISPSEEKGYLLCQDLSYSFRRAPLRLWFRYALCSTEGWDSRLYAWENDLLSSFSVPALYGECSRSFLMLSWKPGDRIEFRAKYAVTASDTDMKRQIKQEVRVQCRMEF